MLVSHESPISMLEASGKYNDYDYALVHLFEKYFGNKTLNNMTIVTSKNHRNQALEKLRVKKFF